MGGYCLRSEGTGRQLWAWRLCVMSVPATMALAGRGWLWVLAGSVLAAAVMALQLGLQRRAGMSTAQALVPAYGAAGGRILALLTLLWLAAAAAAAAFACQIAFEDDLGILAPAVPLLLAAVSTRHSSAVPERVMGVIGPILATLYSIILIAALRHVEPAWCQPRGNTTDGALAFCLLLAPVCLTYGEKRTAKLSWPAIGTLAVSPGAVALLVRACLSPELAQTQALPLYMMTKSLSVLSVMQRFEVLLSVCQMLGIYAVLCMLAQAAEGVQSVIGGREWGTGWFCVLAFAGSLVIARVPLWIWAIGGGIFWGMIPILTQVIVNIKNNRKI